MSVPRTKVRFVGLLIKLVCCALIFWIIASHVDFGVALGRLSQTHLLPFLLGTGLIIAQHVFAAARWQAVISACGSALDLKTCLIGYLESNFFNQALPSTVGGDAIRVWRSQTSGVQGGIAVLAVLLDRAFGLLVLAALALIGGVTLVLTEPHGSTGLGIVTASLAIIVGAVLGGLFSTVFPGSKHNSFLKPVYLMSYGVRRVVTDSHYAVPVFAGSLIGHLITVVALWVLAGAISLDFTLYGALLSLPAILLASAVPISISGWGVREATTVAVVTGLGLDNAENALALGLIFGLSLLVVGLTGGLVWFLESLMQFKDSASEKRPDA